MCFWGPASPSAEWAGDHGRTDVAARIWRLLQAKLLSHQGLSHWLLGLQLIGWGHPNSQVPLAVKNPPTSAEDIRDEGSIPGSGRSPGGGHGSPLQCSCLENPTDRGAWPATVHKVAKNQTQLKQFSAHGRTHPDSRELSASSRSN